VELGPDVVDFDSRHDVVRHAEKIMHFRRRRNLFCKIFFARQKGNKKPQG
jgi:hypothetical protein